MTAPIDAPTPPDALCRTCTTDANAADSGQESETAPLRTLDMINTDKSARELLDNRVRYVNLERNFRNDIYCGPGDYVSWLRARGHTVHVVEQPRGLSPIPLLRATWQTWRLLRRERYDIVHTHGSVIGVIGRIAALLARTPLVVHQVHGFHHHPEMPRSRQALFIWIERLMGYLSDRLVFQNEVDLRECLRVRIAPQRKLVCVGNGISLEKFHPGEPPHNDPPVVLCVSRFEPVKNHLMILRTAGVLHDRGVRFRLLLVGEGECRSACEAWVRKHGLEECVTFLGYRDDVPLLTRNAEVCALVSIKEGLPRALIEAAASGRPAVASDVVGNRDTVVNGVTGFLVRLDDAEAMADRVAELLSDRSLQQRMGEAAAARARQLFDEESVTRRIMAVYREGLTAGNKRLRRSPQRRATPRP